MQEYGWVHWNDFRDMLGVVERCPDRRKARLAACAMARAVWDRAQDPRTRAAVEVAEAYADFRAPREQLRAAHKAAESAVQNAERVLSRNRGTLADLLSPVPGRPPRWFVAGEADFPAVHAARLGELVSRVANFGPGMLSVVFDTVRPLLDSERKRRPALCDLLREVYGNPFRPPAFDPTCRTSTVVAIARGMYESGDFGAMPILADALQDADCESGDILDHCRSPGPHVRGCWVVDLVLDKRVAPGQPL